MLSVKETQDIALEIMQQIHLFCEQENLVYCMAYGTLLGAVRHKGYIPWDNDVDIIMPRPDFERFLKIVKKREIAPNLKCLHYTNDAKYHYQVIRVCDTRTKVIPSYIREQPSDMGIWVDIFPADGVPESVLDHPLQQMKLWFNKWVQLADIYAIPMKRVSDKSAKGLLKNIMKNTVHLLFPGKNNIHNYRIDQAASSFAVDKYAHLADTIERQKPLYLTHEDFEQRTLMPFEQYAFYGPKNWDSYLSRAYGDYMQLPPVEKRMPHDINAEWID